MRLIIQNDYDALSKWAAAYIVRRIREHGESAAKEQPGSTDGPYTAASDRPFVLGLPTGSSPVGMYRELIAFHRKGLVSFENVVTFNMDEYVGLEAEDPRSYHSFMWDKLFSHIDIKKENVHILDGMGGSLTAECSAYEQAIEAAGGIDLFVGGIGPDGHIAFNEPGSSLSSRTRIKTLTHDTRVANSRFFDGDVNRVPEQALTVGVGTIMAAREVLLLASGHHKARALEKVIQQGVNHMWTVSCLQLHPHAIIVCDDEATVELKVGTVNYFRDIEAVNLDYNTLLEPGD